MGVADAMLACGNWGMKILINIGVIVASTILVYFLHAILMAEVIPIILFVFVLGIVVADYPRRYFYLVGLSLYPMTIIINVALSRDQSLYPIVIFYELATIALILFGAYLGPKVKHWTERKLTS
jgi:hypothetical protein